MINVVFSHFVQRKVHTLTHFSSTLYIQNATIQSIGKGIIGSAAEESGRKIVNWKQGSSYFLPCLSGVACGWVNTTKITEEKISSGDNDDAKNPSGDDGDSVVLYTMKVSPRDLERNQKEDETQQLSPWVAKAVELFDSMSSVETSDEIMMSAEQSAKVSEIFDLVLTQKLSFVLLWHMHLESVMKRSS